MSNSDRHLARRPSIAVIGDARITLGSRHEALAHAVGCGVVAAGYRLVTGGMGGVMEAAPRGARDPANWFDGVGNGILTGTNPRQATHGREPRRESGSQ